MGIKPRRSCYQTALTLLARRDHSCGELVRKLEQKNYPEDEIQAAIKACQRLGYIDDRRYADIYSRQLQRNGYGRRRIRQMLKSKYVPEPIIDAAVENRCTDAMEESRCRQLLHKKTRAMSGDRQRFNDKAKLYRYLLSRGFSPAVIQAVIDEVESNGGSEWAPIET